MAKSLETPLIADREKRILSAFGYKQLNRIIDKAAEVKGTNRYAKDFKPIADKVRELVYSLVFEHNISKEQLSQLNKVIKINNTTL